MLRIIHHLQAKKHLASTMSACLSEERTVISWQFRLSELRIIELGLTFAFSLSLLAPGKGLLPQVPLSPAG
ncbi:hypothetical protein RRG08_001990 [Elysia crispata]|uniref:Uncharacterized protein n=1 Tax=Elysia crispata TaxID=231223 RepID=A0AAE1BAV3_9GAST|nr:hypothetical protein RRG08_001990 [Elysia crispata]